MRRYKILLFFILINLFVKTSFAGGFDSSGQPFDIIFGREDALRFSLKYIKPVVDISASRNLGEGRGLSIIDVSDLAQGYTELLFSLGYTVNDRVKCASQLEQPFRYYTRYQDDSLSYLPDSNNVSQSVPAPFESEYKSVSLSFACGYSFSFKHDTTLFSESKLSVIAGPKYQDVSGVFSSDLSYLNLGEEDNYEADLKGSEEWGYLLGVSYEIPEIALRISAFYHSEIHHELQGHVSAPRAGFSSRDSLSASAKTLTPQSFNVSIQSGIAEDWLAFVKLRWGDWSKLESIDVDAGVFSQKIGLFSQDTLNYKLGLGYRVNDILTLGGYFSSLAQLGDKELPIGVDGDNIRNPDNGRFSIGLGGKYKVTQQLHIDLGASYFYVKAGKFVDNNYTVDLASSYALALAGAVTYQY